jgi:hypothetical protein
MPLKFDLIILHFLITNDRLSAITRPRVNWPQDLPGAAERRRLGQAGILPMEWKGALHELTSFTTGSGRR